MKIRTGDHVVVITGKDKGKTGQVLRVIPLKNRLVVADVNMRKRHMRATVNRPGEIIKYEASIHASNVMLVDSKSKKRTRVGYKVDEKGKKRIAKRGGEVIAKAAVAAPKGVDKKAATKAAEKVAAKKTPTPSTEKKSPFWKKMGFGAEELERVGDTGETTHMKEDHSVPDQIERSSGRGSTRGS